MTLSVWKEGQLVANILGVISPSPTIEFPQRHRCVLDTQIVGDDHYEIYPSNGSGKRMHVEGVTCWPDNGQIVFVFLETGYVLPSN